MTYIKKKIGWGHRWTKGVIKRGWDGCCEGESESESESERRKGSWRKEKEKVSVINKEGNERSKYVAVDRRSFF